MTNEPRTSQVTTNWIVSCLHMINFILNCFLDNSRSRANISFTVSKKFFSGISLDTIVKLKEDFSNSRVNRLSQHAVRNHGPLSACWTPHYDVLEEHVFTHLVLKYLCDMYRQHKSFLNSYIYSVHICIQPRCREIFFCSLCPLIQPLTTHLLQ